MNVFPNCKDLFSFLDCTGLVVGRGYFFDGCMDDPVGGELFQQRGEFRSAGQVELPVTDPHGFRSADRSDIDAEDFGIVLLLQDMAD